MLVRVSSESSKMSPEPPRDEIQGRARNPNPLRESGTGPTVVSTGRGSTGRRCLPGTYARTTVPTKNKKCMNDNDVPNLNASALHFGIENSNIRTIRPPPFTVRRKRSIAPPDKAAVDASQRWVPPISTFPLKIGAWRTAHSI